ncbi:MAG: hypothetical protein AB8G96_12500 [Phycisphaerales bacterium]
MSDQSPPNEPCPRDSAAASSTVRTSSFEGRMAELEATIETLPEEARGSLRELATETRQRHAANTENLEAANRALAVLDITEQLAALNMQMVIDAAQRMHAAPPPSE